MLVEIRSSAFKEFGRIRPPVRFHEGLNVILGTKTGANSIGKSTFLMILDFVFGGDDYAVKIRDAANHVGEHVIQFAFHFGNKQFFFSRGTANFTTVTCCDPEYQPIETWSVQKYREFLAEKYGLNDSGLSFREMVSRFIRVYHRENHNELRPLDAFPQAKGTLAIQFLLKSFGLFQSLEKAQQAAEESRNSLEALRIGVKYGHVESVATKRQAQELTKHVADLRRMQGEAVRSADLQGKSAEEALRVVNLKRDLQVARAKKSRLDFQIEQLKSQEAIGNIPFVDDFRAVERLFPGISIKRLEEIEAFHRQLVGILADEVAEEIELAEKELVSTKENIGRLETALADESELGGVSRRVLKEFAEYEKEISEIEKRLEKRADEEQLKEATAALLKRYRDKSADAFVSIETAINGKMAEIDSEIYEGIKDPPLIRLKPTGYEFHTLNDEGTGTAFKSMVVLDLSIMELTRLPLLVHDSLVFKNIGDEPLSKLIQMYQKQSPKQMFIALDKADSYDSQTCADLERLAVLHLSDDQGALFGKSWSKKETKA